VLAVLDACVLYPPSLRDLLLTLSALDAFDARWSEEILEELVRTVLAKNPDIERVRFEQHTVAAMRRHFPNAVVPVDPALVATLDNHPKDRHVAAAAIAAGATTIVTLNVKDFRGRALADAGVEVVTPGDLVGRLLDDIPESVVLAVQQISARWRNPLRSANEVASILEGHPSMGQPMRRVAELIPADR